METRDPIHLGSGEPIVMLHPFLCSQAVWRTVADQLADTGRRRGFWTPPT
jgi:pimeloyl-ACP methyl ester carboxylesterase